jgi:drug/metabolite transporter (DMT)-like permease
LVTFGRFSALVTVLGTIGLVVALMLSPELGRPAASSIRLIDYVGALVALSFPVTWLTAIWHWGTRMPPYPGKGSWGVAVVLGFVLGAAAYWFWGVRPLSRPQDGTVRSQRTAV